MSGVNPLVSDLARFGADFAVFGVPFDCVIGYRPGPRLVPRAISDMSTRLALPWGPENPGYWEVSEDRSRALVWLTWAMRTRSTLTPNTWTGVSHTWWAPA